MTIQWTPDEKTPSSSGASSPLAKVPLRKFFFVVWGALALIFVAGVAFIQDKAAALPWLIGGVLIAAVLAVRMTAYFAVRTAPRSEPGPCVVCGTVAKAWCAACLRPLCRTCRGSDGGPPKCRSCAAPRSAPESRGGRR